MPTPTRLIIYRRAPSASAKLLAATLRDMGVKAYKLGRLPLRPRGTDKYVAWGDVPPVNGSLNGAPVCGKFTEATVLTDAGVSSIDARGVRPDDGQEWLRRAHVHHSADDLRSNFNGPGFWVKKEEIAAEYRVHVFNGVSIRVAKKAERVDFSGPYEGRRRDGEYPHPWIRSLSTGWVLDYGLGQRGIRQRHRDVATQAVAALGLTFGAVDVAERPDKSVFVLEVNRAPGFDGNGETVKVYARKIKQWMEEGR